MVNSVYVASDHGGVHLKNEIIAYLKQKEIQVIEIMDKNETLEYPYYAQEVAYQVVSNNAVGILVCGTGIGMSIAANKIKGARASVVSDCYSARMTREHNDSNVLCLGERVVGSGLALEIVNAYLTSSFLGGRHTRRVKQICELER